MKLRVPEFRVPPAPHSDTLGQVPKATYRFPQKGSHPNTESSPGKVARGWGAAFSPEFGSPAVNRLRLGKQQTATNNLGN